MLHGLLIPLEAKLPSQNLDSDPHLRVQADRTMAERAPVVEAWAGPVTVPRVDLNAVMADGGADGGEGGELVERTMPRGSDPPSKGLVGGVMGGCGGREGWEGVVWLEGEA